MMSPLHKSGVAFAKHGFKKRNASNLTGEQAELFLNEIVKRKNRDLLIQCRMIRNKCGLSILVNSDFPNEKASLNSAGAIVIPYNAVSKTKLRKEVVKYLRLFKFVPQ